MKTTGTKLADLCESHKFATLENTKFDVCSCMFAFHYFLKSSETWSSILRTLKDAVKVGGYFFATFFDAAKIEKLVVGDNKPWICRGGSSGEPVLSLTRDRSKENKADVFGKKLIVFAETIGQHPEFLLDRDWLVKEMKSHGFELCNHNMRTGHFSDMYVVFFALVTREHFSNNTKMFLLAHRYARYVRYKKSDLLPHSMRPFSFSYCWVMFRRVK